MATASMGGLIRYPGAPSPPMMNSSGGASMGGAPGGRLAAGGWDPSTFAASSGSFIDPSTALQNQYGLYGGAVGQNLSDYSNLMKGYGDLASSSPLSTSTYTPTTYNYNPSASFTSAIANLGDLAKTGGYSDANIADLRARGISPIRSVYANAQNNIMRQKALQGGYSPNLTASIAKMTRDESQGIADATQNVNAGLAQNIASNRLAAASPYASAAGQESAAENQAGEMNADRSNQGQQFNIGNQLAVEQGNLGARLSGLEGMRSLYGTTPALSALFGNQAAQAAQMNQNAVQNRIANGTGLARIAASGMGRA